MFKLSHPFVLAVFCASLLAGCTPMGAYDTIQGTKAAGQAVADFHQALDKGQFEEIYAAVDSDFKKSEHARDFVPLLTAVHRKLGNVLSTTSAGSRVSTFNLQTTVVLAYRTKFAEGDGEETFTYRINAGKAVLVGYNISSLTLILK